MISLSISKHVFVAAMVLACIVAIRTAEARRPYEAVFVDGSRAYGDKLSGWGVRPARPRLDDTSLHDARRPLRWLRARRVERWSPGQNRRGYIEFVGGDRIVGSIAGVGAGDGLYVPKHLIVKLDSPLGPPSGRSPYYVRISPELIQRVVFRSGATPRKLTPGAVFRRNGGKIVFSGLRWGDESLALLLEDGSAEVRMADISEIHLPRIDPWRAYYRQLAVLSPACRSRMLRMETSGGLIATASSMRFSSSAYSSPQRRRSADERVKQLTARLASVRSNQAVEQRKLKLLETAFRNQADESKRLLAEAVRAHDNALVRQRRRMTRQRQADAAELDKQRGELDADLLAIRKEEEHMLTKAPFEKHSMIIEAFVAREGQLRRTRQPALDDMRRKHEIRRGQEALRLQQLIAAKKRTLSQRTKELQNKLIEPKRLIEEHTLRCGKLLAQLESIKSQIASIRQGSSETWRHIVQPAWSLDPLWIPFSKILMRWSFAPHDVPLSLIRPASEISPPFLTRRTNRSFNGGPLRSGEADYAWGFAVHAYSELRFEIPRLATAFRGRVGLDNVVGPGGCARARVFVGSTDGRPAYESPLLIGSRRTVDTGRVALKPRAGASGLLVLQADPADRKPPSGSDPLNIRDKLDWLDPRVELDAATVQEEVLGEIGSLLSGGPEWSVRTDRHQQYVWTCRFEGADPAAPPRFRTMVHSRQRPFALVRKMKVGPSDKWLAVYASTTKNQCPPPGAVMLHADGCRIRPRKTPLRQDWQDKPAPVLFPLDEHQGRKVTLELSQKPGGEPLHWRAIRISSIPPPAYRLVDIMEFVGKSDMKVSFGLGRALQSADIGKAEKLAALEISQRGGRVNIKPHPAAKPPSGTLANVLIGGDWTGGDKTFVKMFDSLKKMSNLEKLLVTEKSGVSASAVAKLQAQMPKLSIARIIERTPSPVNWVKCTVTWRNHTDKKVIVLYINEKGRLQGSRRLAPGQTMVRSARSGYSYEAHYELDTYHGGEEYRLSLPLSSFIVKDGAVWDIRP